MRMLTMLTNAPKTHIKKLESSVRIRIDVKKDIKQRSDGSYEVAVIHPYKYSFKIGISVTSHMNRRASFHCTRHMIMGKTQACIQDFLSTLFVLPSCDMSRGYPCTLQCPPPFPHRRLGGSRRAKTPARRAST